VGNLPEHLTTEPFLEDFNPAQTENPPDFRLEERETLGRVGDGERARREPGHRLVQRTRRSTEKGANPRRDGTSSISHGGGPCLPKATSRNLRDHKLEDVS